MKDVVKTRQAIFLRLGWRTTIVTFPKICSLPLLSLTFSLSSDTTQTDGLQCLSHLKLLLHFKKSHLVYIWSISVSLLKPTCVIYVKHWSWKSRIYKLFKYRKSRSLFFLLSKLLFKRWLINDLWFTKPFKHISDANSLTEIQDFCEMRGQVQFQDSCP